MDPIPTRADDNGMIHHANFATLHGKPKTFTEYGLWPSTRSPGGGGDNPVFIRRMAQWMRDHAAAYHVYNEGHGDHSLNNYPNAKAAYREEFQASAGPATTTAVPTSVIDTAIMSKTPTTNYGSASTMTVDGDEPSGSGYDSYGLLKFDLSSIPAGKTIQSVALKLNVTDASSQTYQIYGLKKPWVENGATWRLFKSSSPWEINGAKGVTDRTSSAFGTVAAPSVGMVSTSLGSSGVAQVQSWVNTPSSNHGFIIANPSSTDGFDFATRSTTNRPTLVIVYA